MTESEDLAVEAYLYYYALVENVRQIQRYVTTGVGSNPAAPFNTFSHARKLAGPQDTFVTINNDTIYSMASLDLSVGPLILEVPDLGDRYYVLQFVDAWSNNIAYVGTRATGSAAGRYLVVPPGWTGTPPPDHTVIRASTTITAIVGRFACTGADDVPAVNAIQDALVLRPADPDAGEPAGIPAADDDLSEQVLFWEQARLWSQAFPAPPQDDTFRERFSPLGTDQDVSPYADAELVATVTAGYDAGVERLEYLTHHGSSPVNNGWTVGMHMFDYNSYALGPGTLDDDHWKIADPQRRIVERAVADRLGLWGNHGYEAVYAQAFTDIDGQPLTGEKSYTVTLPEPPPVGAFWSTTLYDIPRYYLVDNPIDRYSIGDRTAGIRYADDGSLTISLSHAEPEGDQRANWLPTPDGRFRLVMRLYIPGEAVLDGSYAFPAINPT